MFTTSIFFSSLEFQHNFATVVCWFVKAENTEHNKDQTNNNGVVVNRHYIEHMA